MAIIRIIEREMDSDGTFLASLNFIESERTLPVIISDPFSQRENNHLEWYFEEYSNTPFLDTEKAKKVEESILGYGKHLFRQVFVSNPDGLTFYQACLNVDIHAITIEIVGSSAFQRLHWEAMYDPHIGFLAQHIVFVRRSHPHSLYFPLLLPEMPIVHILLIVARPKGNQDAGYRTISRPLIELSQSTNVKIDIVRPGTYVALEQHLKRHRPGTYQIIHFDMHGAVRQTDKTTEAVLYFEREVDTAEEYIEARKIAHLLQIHQIPIVVLNACQSAKQVDIAQDTILASYLLEAGVQAVLAMSYSVTISAAQIIMSTFYQHLLWGYEFAQAVCAVRRQLKATPERNVSFGEKITLEDWILPVVYEIQPIYLRKRVLSTYKQEISFLEHTQQANILVPAYDFLDRDRDIMNIERGIIACNILLIRGMGGSGKTILLHHLGWWWQKTWQVQKVIHFSYRERIWRCEQVVDSIARILLNADDYHDQMQFLTDDEKKRHVVKFLKEERHLLVFDNLELLTGQSQASLNILTENEQQELYNFLKELRGGNTLVMLASRSDEAWLATGLFDHNIYDLRGLNPDSSTYLVDHILKRINATNYRKEDELHDLLKLLADFPGALEIVLPNLKTQTPAQILYALQTGASSLNVGANERGTQNISSYIDTYYNLSKLTQRMLLCLAPFTLAINKQLLPTYIDTLKAQVELNSLPLEELPTALHEALRWGLISLDTQHQEILHIHPLLPHFLRRLLHDETESFASAINYAFCRFYNQHCTELNLRIQSQKVKKNNIIADLEYINLKHALFLMIDAKTSFQGVFITISIYLKIRSEYECLDRLAEKVLSKLSSISTELRWSSYKADTTAVLYQQGDALIALEKYPTAYHAYQNTLGAILARTDVDDIQKQLDCSWCYRQLSVITFRLSKWEDCRNYNQKALEIAEKWGDLGGKIISHLYLGILDEQHKRWKQAEKHLDQGIELLKGQNNNPMLGPIYFHKGVLAQEQGYLEKAKEHYGKAAKIFSQSKDHFNEAKVYSQSANMYIQLNQWKPAQKELEYAIQIYYNVGDRYTRAGIYLSLGNVSSHQRHWHQAEHYYKHALAFLQDVNDEKSQASVYFQLGSLEMEQRHWNQADRYLKLALEIYENADDFYHEYLTYQQLARLALEQRQPDLFDVYDQKAQYMFQKSEMPNDV